MKNVLLLSICLFSVAAFGQLNNRAFEQRMLIDESEADKLFLGIHMLGFGKNNEYFDTTIEGYTLMGYQINPYLSYHIAGNARFDAGIYAQRDFGNDEYSEVTPTLSLKIKSRNFNFIFGTLEGSLSHRLIEPLYDFERVLNRRLENGMQALWIKDDLFLDCWVDWRHMIYFNDTEPEKFTAGISFNKTFFRKGSFHADIPVQILADHQGGQIDSVANPVITRYNAAGGLAAEVQSSGFVRAYGVQGFFVASTTSENIPFKDGNGIFINPYVSTRIGLTIMGSYWKGDQFLSIQGGQVYPSITDNYPYRSDEVREFFMLRFLYDLKVTDGLSLAVRAEPFYDTYAQAVEYSYGFYLNFSDRFFLLNAKKNR